jgi:PIN domain nuclease of toxin-antitoxin system
MQLLLDTHTFIWFVDDDPSLSQKAKQLIEDAANTRWLSIANPWEMAIKYSIGKLTLNTPLAKYLDKNLPLHMVQLLPIQLTHLATVSTLPLHHRDPFDRLIISQAMVENLTVVSADADFDRYPIQRAW